MFVAKRSPDHREEESQSLSDQSPDSVEAPIPGQSLFGEDAYRSVDTDHRTFAGYSVLIVAGDGVITDILQPPELTDVDAPSPLIGSVVDTLWQGEPADRLAAQIKRALRSRQVVSTEFPTLDGKRYHDFVFIPQGRNRVLLVERDISERMTAFSRMEQLAFLDDRTKLPNRLFLLEELARCIDDLKLKEGRAAVISLDVCGSDGQSSASNTKQHDAIFLEFASRLVHELRGANATDVEDYDRYTVAARIEYSQFAVILPAIVCGEDAERVAQRLIDVLQEPVKLANRNIRMTVRAGIALFPQDGEDAPTLFANAVAAMDDARNNAATQYKLHSGTIRLRALQRQDLEIELRGALNNEEFDVEFLPIVAADSRQIRSVEALLRWPKNVFGPQSIQKVIAIAENTGLILPIGDWVLEKCCEAFCHWRDHGWGNPRVSLNLSVQEFFRHELIQRIEETLQKFDIHPRSLDIEITEYTLFRDAMKNYSVCTALRSLGIGVIVDDYGTGACSLAHVARSPVDAIKVDNSFVTSLGEDDHDRAACAAIVAMGKALGKRVIAEGIETESQARYLASLGCDELQGFLITRPTSVQGMQELISEGHCE